jgi:hypothetical protein
MTSATAMIMAISLHPIPDMDIPFSCADFSYQRYQPVRNLEIKSHGSPRPSWPSSCAKARSYTGQARPRCVGRVLPHLTHDLRADRYDTQAMRMHAPSGGVQIPQLALQQTCPGGQMVGPHTCRGHNASEHATPLGIHMPPQAGQQVVPAWQSVTAHGLGEIATQTPEQSAPPVAGSQVSSGSSMQANPGGQGKPAKPPQRCCIGVGVAV